MHYKRQPRLAASAGPAAPQTNLRRLRAYIRTFERDLDEIADIEEETLIGVWEATGYAKLDGVSWQDVLTACQSVNRTRDRLRTRDLGVRRRGRIRETRFLTGQAPDRERAMALDAADAVACDLLCQLPQRQFQAVLFHVALGKSEHETAVLMNCAVGTVKAHCHRGLAKLRALGENLLDPRPE
ncbi:MAG TPA: sigma factor-like helix-turn-helix DNA-binding protein [Gemmatimonadaceae bacterium]|jgi:DNA-directed RNA polymerase specialized sigma24 family protein|nr:sigma factor-like helix-turn-helix DNA-binding protein [Gemmatimonadaceae bacterium]